MRRHPVFFIFLLLFFVTSNRTLGQQNTRTDLLTSAASRQKAFEKKTSEELIRLSARNGWPLTLTGPEGKFALLTGVDLFGYPIYTTTDNNIRSAATIRTTYLWPGGVTGLNLSGADNSVKGKLAVWDGGAVRGTHVELTGRVNQKDAPVSQSDHSTHVAGTMIASGVNPLAKGMSFGQQELIAYDYSGHISEMMNEAPNLLVSNHSYGAIAGWYYNDGQSRWEFWGRDGETEDYKFGYYSNDAQLFDSIAYNAPYYLIVKSSGNNRNQNGPAVGANYWRYDATGTMVNAGSRPAGISSNDSYDIISTYGTSKNILTVGAVNPIDAGYNRVQDVVMSSFSSWGPTDDGRIKPDVVADGVNLVSCIASSNTAYANYSGTSMASPSTAGSVMLLQEYYARLHSGAFLRSSSLKGIIIHTSDESGSNPGPDYQFGWGLINMEKAAAVITSENSRQLILENTLNNSTTFSLPVVASGEGILKATICWTDPKGTVETVNVLDNPAPKLVNDLDLRIKKGAATYMPWVLDPASPSAAATRGDNIRDNVEKVEVTDVVPGETYTIEVTHKGNLERGSQVYSLIVSGAGGAPYCSSAATTTAGARIDSIAFGSYENLKPAGCSDYSNFTNQTINVETNTAVPFYVKLSSCDGTSADKIVKAFIDFNNDGDFDDADELVATSSVITGAGDFSGNVIIPATASVGNFSILRVVVQETNNPGVVTACGNYLQGETQDYRIQFLSPSKDLGVAAIVSPVSGDCSDGSQYISILLQNFGKTAQANIPVSVIVKEGTTTISTINTNYPGTVAEYGITVFTLQTPFIAEAGKTYTITASTLLPGDQNAANNQQEASVMVPAAAAGPAGEAEICGSNQVFLKVTSPTTTDIYSWYDTPSAVTPIASGPNTSSTVITANQTYYVSKNDPGSRIGPVVKTDYPDGGYNSYTSSFIRFTNDMPVLIKSARLYIGNPGKINFIVANIVSFNETTGAYSYVPLASSTIDVYATDPTPQPGLQNGNDPADLGAVYLLNLPVLSTGSHAIIVQCQDGATIFRNNNIAANPYPFTIPGVFSITGNSAVTSGDPNYYQKFYYFLYDIKLDIGTCPTERSAVVATTAQVPTITVNGNDLTSSAALNYQWYFNGNPISGANAQTYSATQSGTYKVATSDLFNCQQFSSDLNFTLTGIADINAAEIGLTALPNPNNGNFIVRFEMKKKSDMLISLLNMAGQEVYRKFYSDFIGIFYEPLKAPNLSSGVYMLKIEHGQKTYLKKILVNSQ